MVFSRPPYSKQEQSELVYYSMASIYLLCAVVMLVGVNLDQAERRRRIARSIVPHEIEPFQFCCVRFMAHKESVPCEITEQYYLDARLLHLQTAQSIAERRLRMNLWQYAFSYAANFFEVLTRKHLCLSFLLRAIPTFTRVKRAILIILEFNICMATASVAINIREHHAPRGRYELFTCPGSASDCLATVPMALISAAVLCPVFHFTAVYQMRLTCFVAQTHPSSSRFPLGARKFASLAPRSFLEKFCCMRSGYERRKDHVTKSRSCIHRAVEQLWRTTRPSVNDLRFYSAATSWFILFLMLSFVIGTVVYLFEITVYFKDSVVYHWLAWTLVMFFSCVFVNEPLWIFWTDVVWCALVSNLAQYWGFGSHALAATTRYKEIVRQVEELYLSGMRDVASQRIQRWWLAVLDMYRAIHEQTAAAIKIQAIRKKMNQKRKYVKDRKWCLKVEVQSCSGLEQANGSHMMSPLVRLTCDTGNPTVLQTKVAWQSGDTPVFNETFYVDIKESNAMYVSVWAKDLINEEFIGRGYFAFTDLKSSDKDVPEGYVFNVPLYQIEHGDRPLKAPKHSSGQVSLRVYFLDPLKEPCGEEGQEDWMLPKNRMKFALSKMNPGGKLKVGKMLGNLVPSKAAGPGGEVVAEAAGSRPATGGPTFGYGVSSERLGSAIPTIPSAGSTGSGFHGTGSGFGVASGGLHGRAGSSANLPQTPPEQVPRRKSEIGDVNVMAEYEGAKMGKPGPLGHNAPQGMPLLRSRSGVVRSNGEGFRPGSSGAFQPGASIPLSNARPPAGLPPGGPGAAAAGRQDDAPADPASRRGSDPFLSLTPTEAANAQAELSASMPGVVSDSETERIAASRPPPGAGVGDF